MGCFNFDCYKCGEGVTRDDEGGEWDGREYFCKPVRINVLTKHGRTVVLEGVYSGYGEVNVEFGGKKIEFYPKQFQEFWDVWTTKGQIVAEEIYCEDCMEDIPLTSRVTFDLSDFTLAIEYMATHEKPPGWMDPHKLSLWGTRLGGAVGGAPVSVPVPVPTNKLKKVVTPKPTPLKKDDLLKMVAEMKAELEHLRPLKDRFVSLEAEANELRESVREKTKQLSKIRKALDTW